MFDDLVKAAEFLPLGASGTTVGMQQSLEDGMTVGGAVPAPKAWTVQSGAVGESATAHDRSHMQPPCEATGREVVALQIP